METGIIESCAMSLRIYFRKGAKNTAKEERLSLSERHRKTKKYQTLPEGATQTTQHTTRLFQFLRYHKCLCSNLGHEIYWICGETEGAWVGDAGWSG